ncbi:MAG TPA: PAS domain-containing sensor histidine kinase [bacterium]
MNNILGIQESKNVKIELEHLISYLDRNPELFDKTDSPGTSTAQQHSPAITIIAPSEDHVSQNIKNILVSLEKQNNILRSKIKETENRFQALFQSSSNAIIAINSKGSIQSTNQKLIELGGFSTNEVAARKVIYELFIKKDRKRIDKILKNLDEKECPDGVGMVKASFICSNKATRFVELKFAKIPGQAEIFVLINDLTERKKYDDEIQRIKKELTILNTIARSVKQPKDFHHLLNLVLEKTGNLINMEMGAIFLGDQYVKNLQPCVTIGMTHEDAIRLLQTNFTVIQRIKKEKTELFLNPSNGFFRDLFAKQPKCRSIVIVPLLIRKNRFGILALSSKKQVTLDQEKKNFISAIGHQLSIHIENAILFNELEDKTHEVEAKNAELSSFVCTVSHDLKTPLIAFHGYLGLFLEHVKYKIDDTATDYLNRAQYSAEYMEKMIGDLLKLSRAGRVAGVKRRFSTYKLVDEVYMSLYPQMQQKKINFLSSKTLPVIYGDRQRFQIVFENLIGNAIKYSSPNRLPQIEVHCQDRKKFYEFSVKDNGIGIDPENHQRIFEVFQKCSNDDDDRTGTGVGLTIVQKIVEHYGGKIWVDSRLDKGATFYFTLPKS